MSDLSAASPMDYATGGSHGQASPFRIDHSSVLGWAMIALLALLGLIHFTFGVNVGTSLGR